MRVPRRHVSHARNQEPDLRRAFRARALAAAVAVATGVLAWTCFRSPKSGRRSRTKGLVGRDGSLAFQIVTAAEAVGAIAALWTDRYKFAQALAVVQVTLIVCGWGFAQYPLLIPPDVTITNAAAPPSVLRAILAAAEPARFRRPALRRGFSGSRRPRSG